MAEASILKLDPDAHLLLEQPLLRLPQELLKMKFKAAQRSIDAVNKHTTTSVQASKSQTPAETLASLDATLQKAQNLKRKLEALHVEEQVLHSQQKARIEHLQTLHEIPSLSDVAYDRWSHVRLDRLLVDYLLRSGYTQSAKELAEENKLGGLVDVGVFEEARRIEQALERGDVKDALSWCAENKNALKKINVGLMGASLTGTMLTSR
jgi:macrophage erythroblast attacher